MADPKDAKGAPAHAEGHGDALRDLWIFLAVLALAIIGTYVTTVNLDTLANGSVIVGVAQFVASWWNSWALSGPAVAAFKSLCSWLTVFFIGGSFFFYLKGRSVHHAEHHKYEPLDPTTLEPRTENTQWQIVLDHMNSGNPAEWKLAILEADNMLLEVLDQSGYPGESLGEKLKAINPQSLASYNDAWEAHKIRNQVAHEGAAMDFSQRIAREAIAKFEHVFKELGVIS